MVRLLAASVLLSLIAAPAMAGLMLEAEDFDVRAGGLVMYAPDYLGSDEGKLRVYPDAEIVYQKALFLSSRHGAGVYLFNDAGTRLGVSVGPDFGRDEDDNSHLTGLGDVGFGWDMNIFLDGNFDPYLAGLSVSHEFAKGSGGTLVSGYVGYREKLSERLTALATTSLTWADSDRTQSYFGITAAQSAGSGLPVYSANEGFRDASLSLGLTYGLTPSWDLNGRTVYTRLLEDSANSPITRDENQILFMIGAAYSYPPRKPAP